jgi:hypothetical protein
MDNNSTDYGYAVSIGRRWPVRHHSELGMERTRRPKWWYPHRPKRNRYPWIRNYQFGLEPACRNCQKGYPHPRWDCNLRSNWHLCRGWSSSPTHQGVKREAQRVWRHKSKALLRQGDYDTLPYQTVDWVW